MTDPFTPIEAADELIPSPEEDPVIEAETILLMGIPDDPVEETEGEADDPPPE